MTDRFFDHVNVELQTVPVCVSALDCLLSKHRFRVVDFPNAPDTFVLFCRQILDDKDTEAPSTGPTCLSAL